MANKRHLEELKKGAKNWNNWWKERRKKHPEDQPNFRNADLSKMNLSQADLFKADLTEANLSGANLNGADLNGAILRDTIFDEKTVIDTKWRLVQDIVSNWKDSRNLKGADLSNADLGNAFLVEANLSGANLSNSDLYRAIVQRADLSNADLSGACLIETDFSDATLTGANFQEAHLLETHFYDADLSKSDFRKADIQWVDFNGTVLIEANFSESKLFRVDACEANLSEAIFTGACLEDWNINAQTKLEGVVCEHIFTDCDDENGEFTDRRPHDPNQIFAPGEFTKRYQIVLETVDLFFNDGIDWKAFLDSLQDLKTQYGDDLNIQGIEKKAGGSFVVRLEVPSDADKGEIERNVKALYETKLEILEAKYHVELQAKDREIEIYKQKSADILELAKLAASRPINVEAKAVAENQSSSESYTNNFNNSPIANFANKMQDQASQQANQYIGANLNEITALIQSLRGQVESFPEAQRSEAIDHLIDLETDLQQPPEKRKPSRMKATLLALVGIATAISGAVANTNEFVGQVQELSDKLGIPLPIEQIEPQQPKAIEPQS